MYVVLVGHAGIGKGNAINPAVNLLKEAGTGNVVGDRVTIEYVLEKLSKGFPAVVQSNNGVSFGTDSSCLLAAPELQVFASASQHTLPILTDLWDCREHPFDYGTKTQGKFIIHKPTVNLLGGSTPSWLVESIPTSAVAGGFTRRVNFVYANDSAFRIPWPSSNGSKCFDDLVEDLRTISQIQGEITIEPSARQDFETIYRASRANEFDNEATAAYKVSKWVHCIKLACVLSAARDDGRVITQTDLARAAQAVEEVQDTVDLVFRAVGESDMAIASDRILRYLEVKGFAARNEILRANWRHVSHSDLDVILTTLMQAGLVKETTTGHKILYEAVVQPKVTP
jgi:hypothetical protein